jgi:hypothetical protein
VSLFIAWPWLALVPAVVFGALYARSKTPRIGLTALAWTGYAAYEFGMQRRWLCSGECNIRVDLLLLYPMLLVLSVIALVAAVRGARRDAPDDDGR